MSLSKTQKHNYAVIRNPDSLMVKFQGVTTACAGSNPGRADLEGLFTCLLGVLKVRQSQCKHGESLTMLLQSYLVPDLAS